tara:strand:- start:601 stop:1017 length:417 start_codon:yes stop_codon:yes gene_type:complete
MQIEIGVKELWDWLEDSIRTGKRLPGAIRKQKLSYWMDYPDEYWTTYGYHDVTMRLPPPTSKNISRFVFMLEIMRYVPEVEDRKLMWKRAAKYPWKNLEREFGMHRTNLHKKIKKELLRIIFKIHDEKKTLQKLRKLL